MWGLYVGGRRGINEPNGVAGIGVRDIGLGLPDRVDARDATWETCSTRPSVGGGREPREASRSLALWHRSGGRIDRNGRTDRKDTIDRAWTCERRAVIRLPRWGGLSWRLGLVGPSCEDADRRLSRSYGNPSWRLLGRLWCRPVDASRLLRVGLWWRRRCRHACGFLGGTTRRGPGHVDLVCDSSVWEAGCFRQRTASVIVYKLVVSFGLEGHELTTRGTLPPARAPFLLSMEQIGPKFVLRGTVSM